MDELRLGANTGSLQLFSTVFLLFRIDGDDDGDDDCDDDDEGTRTATTTTKTNSAFQYVFPNV